MNCRTTTTRKLTPRNYIARFILLAMMLPIAILMLQYLQHVGISRETICTPTADKVVTCQHRHSEFLSLRSIDRKPFQLKFAEVTTYQSSHSSCDSYTGYQLDISGLQADGNLKTVTMKSYRENYEQAYADLGKILDLRSGATHEPLILGDVNTSNLLFPLLFFLVWSTYNFGVEIYLKRFVTQHPVGKKIRNDDPVCRPATTWTEPERKTHGDMICRDMSYDAMTPDCPEDKYLLKSVDPSGDT